MLTFTIIILICILALGVSLLASHWNSGAKSGEAQVQHRTAIPSAGVA